MDCGIKLIYTTPRTKCFWGIKESPCVSILSKCLISAAPPEQMNSYWWNFHSCSIQPEDVHERGYSGPNYFKGDN